MTIGVTPTTDLSRRWRQACLKWTTIGMFRLVESHLRHELDRATHQGGSVASLGRDSLGDRQAVLVDVVAGD